MRFSALALTLLASTLPATLAAAVSVANPSIDPNLLFARQTVNGQNSCAGPIVNVYAYLAVSCSKSKSGNTAQQGVSDPLQREIRPLAIDHKLREQLQKHPGPERRRRQERGQVARFQRRRQSDGSLQAAHLHEKGLRRQRVRELQFEWQESGWGWCRQLSDESLEVGEGCLRG